MTWWKFWASTPTSHDESDSVVGGSMPPQREELLLREAKLHSLAPTSMGPGGQPFTDRGQAYDPALRHFRHGFVPEDPAFSCEDQLRAYERLRRRVMAHALRAVVDSGASEHLVLRGSALMSSWFGAAARSPKDLDFVVVPREFGIHEPRAGEMLDAIVYAVLSSPCPGVELRADEVARNHIWTYDRVPGTRLVFRWLADGMPWGSTQLDFVFGEPLPEAPVKTEVILTPGAAVEFMTASKPLSLAWKLMWLHTDAHPRAKDLYDAMLLAESTALPRPLLEQVFRFVEQTPPSQQALGAIDVTYLEWLGFASHHQATADSWRARLEAALHAHAGTPT